MQLEDEERFEQQVLSVARTLWHGDRYSGSIYLSGKERDGVFITDDKVNIIECTTSRKKDKAKQDGKKLEEATRKYASQYPTKAVKGWFITRDEPTADQRHEIRALRTAAVVAVSFEQFRAEIVDAQEYLSCRKEVPFGSARNPDPEQPQDLDQYIPIGLLHQNSETTSYAHDIADHLVSGHSFLITGDYGAGKSMTLRETFLMLRKWYLQSAIAQFPLHLNLREHRGQQNCAEALRRHADNIGFSNPHHLVRAWRGGHLCLILDGVDELTTTTWAQNPSDIHNIRYQTVSLVRNFVQETPSDSAVLMAVRSSYFDSLSEARTALGLPYSTVVLTTDDFSEDQVKEYLARRGWQGDIPDWLPSRPLLLGELASRDMLDPPDELQHLDPASGWDLLLERITDREAQASQGELRPDTIRNVMERIASSARERPDGLGPLGFDSIRSAFHSVLGRQPQEASLMTLQRLPGLGVSEDESAARRFVDESLADACRAGDTVRYAQSPFTPWGFDASQWLTSMGSLGVAVAALSSQRHGPNEGKIRFAIERAAQDECGEIAVDLLRIYGQYLADHGGDSPSAEIRGAAISELSLPDMQVDLGGTIFRDCIVENLNADGFVEWLKSPRFSACYFGVVEGIATADELPSDVFFGECQFGDFSHSFSTTKGILELEIPLPVRVMLTILKKVYLQPGSGRKTSALYRGLDQQSQAYVGDILTLLNRYGFLRRVHVGSEEIWLPVRGCGRRVRSFVHGVTPTGDPLIAEVARLVS